MPALFCLPTQIFRPSAIHYWLQYGQTDMKIATTHITFIFEVQIQLGMHCKVTYFCILLVHALWSVDDNGVAGNRLDLVSFRQKDKISGISSLGSA